MTWIVVEFGGRVLRVPAVKAQGKLWFHWQGETHCVETGTGSRRQQGGASKSHPGLIVAPMPGKITRVHVKIGDLVSKGQAVVVMEAMKMEYTLEADVDGTITELKATEGSQVSLGETLVRIEGKPS